MKIITLLVGCVIIAILIGRFIYMYRKFHSHDNSIRENWKNLLSGRIM